MHWSEKLNKYGYVQLHNFLPDQKARLFRRKILTATDHRTWGLLTTPYGPLTRVKGNIKSKVIDKSRHQQAVRAHKRRQFAFSFYRSQNSSIVAAHSDIHKDFTALLTAKVCPSLGLAGDVRDTFFAAFIKDQFLSYHTDGTAGKYAFVYQLTKEWQVKYGGQLELYPKKIKQFKKVIIPSFNSLMLLKLDHPMPHSVRRLNNPAHKQRITISGWLE